MAGRTIHCSAALSPVGEPRARGRARLHKHGGIIPATVAVTPENVARELEQFLAEARDALVLEDGEPIFEMANARYSINSDRGKCLLQLWSPERNLVRRVLDLELKKDALWLRAQKFGQAKPVKIEIMRDRDRRTPTAKRAARSGYQRMLKRVLEREFPDLSCGPLSTAMDLNRSFSPVYTRGLMKKGRSAFAVLGVNAQESQASVDAALTFAILWMDHCREREAPRAHVEGLKLFVPPAMSAVVRERMSNLNHEAAKFELYELNEREQAIEQLDCRDRGNIKTRLVRCVDESTTRERFAGAIGKVLAMAAETAVVVLSATEIAFRLHGLEFARARIAAERGSFRNAEEITYGAGPYETVLSQENEAAFAGFVQRVVQSRRVDGKRDDALFRMHPERWLESLVVRDLSQLDSTLDGSIAADEGVRGHTSSGQTCYSQVPAFSASDRAMIDVLAATRSGRLAVIELKADEDIHLPLQGLDYWARVRWHHARGEFSEYGYFPQRQLAAEDPLLFLVAPALRVHPATDILLRYFSPEIEWTLLGVDERWRDGVRVVFRKRKSKAKSATDPR
jgi:hypothetical protein